MKKSSKIWLKEPSSDSLNLKTDSNFLENLEQNLGKEKKFILTVLAFFKIIDGWPL
jgi:hypothetical protein